MLPERRNGTNARTAGQSRNGGRPLPSGLNVRHGSFNVEGESEMKQVSFLAICVYYYGKEFFKNPGYALVLLALLFVTHKMATWATWMMGM